MSDKKNNFTEDTYMPESMNVEPQACNSCMTYCQTSCETMCQTGCEVNCQTTCQKSCQNCQGRCESTCQKICQTNCERLCQSTCEIGCMSTCERNCQNCEGSCQSSCQRICQENCERLCQDYCEVNCLATCQVSCQNCEGRCEAACEKSCQNCEGRCETVCEKSCQNCLGNVCLSSCQKCLGNCEENCERLCQENCEINCLAGCQISCENCQGVACQTCQCEGQNNQQPVDEHTNLISAIERVPISLYEMDYVNSNPDRLNIKVDYIRTSYVMESATRKKSDGTIVNVTRIKDFSLPFNQISTDISTEYPPLYSACATFALAAVMTYYSQKLISPSWLHYSNSSNIDWSKSLNMVLKRSSSAPALRYKNSGHIAYTSFNEIKEYIDSGIPVILHCTGNGRNPQHWVVAFGYDNNCISLDDLYVLDSIESTSNLYGREINLAECMSRNGVIGSDQKYNVDIYRVVEEN